MAQLSSYKTLDEKRKIFEETPYFIIDTVSAFDKWYKEVTQKQNEAIQHAKQQAHNGDSDDNVFNHYPYIFRGVGDARFKLFTSAQRDWAINDMEQWSKKTYLAYVDDIVKRASSLPLLSSVFKYYKLHHTQTDFPTLSILQHYGAPTPLIDFTYNLDVALYFATEFCTPGNGQGSIENYFSLNIVDRSNQRKDEFLNILKFNLGSFPTLRSFFDWQENPNSIFYISDFENNYDRRRSQGFKDQRPLTILFNQRIIPQEGLFVFNPSPFIPLEDCFDSNFETSNLQLNKMICVNIKKDLSEYVRRKIKMRHIDKSYIYPELDSYTKVVKNDILDKLAK